MAAPEIIVLPLNEAVLCADCQMVTNTRNSRCIACGSIALLSLAQALAWEESESMVCDA